MVGVLSQLLSRRNKTMANHNRRVEKEQVQEVLLDDPNFLKELVQRVLQQVLETQMNEHIGAAPYQRTEDRKGQRNGYKPRTRKTRLGKLELLAPQDIKSAPSPPPVSPASKET